MGKSSGASDAFCISPCREPVVLVVDIGTASPSTLTSPEKGGTFNGDCCGNPAHEWDGNDAIAESTLSWW